MNPETKLQRQIMVELSDAGATVFRNETGNFWAGRELHRSGNQITLADARMVPCGLSKGSSDIIGWQSVTITPDMVGQKLAVFSAFEVKTKTGRATKEQKRFIDAINNAGGIAGVVRSPLDALMLLPRRD